MNRRPLPPPPPSKLSQNRNPETMYTILGISTSATQTEVKKAYKSKALATHPDKLDQNASREEIQQNIDHFLRIREAFEILHDADRRKEYDLRYHAAFRRTPLSSSNNSPAEEIEKRDRDRESWAKKQKDTFEERMSSIREQDIRRQKKKSDRQPPTPSPTPTRTTSPPYSPTRFAPPSQDTKPPSPKKISNDHLRADYVSMVDKVLAELFMETPEWEARKAKLNQRNRPPPPLTTPWTKSPPTKPSSPSKQAPPRYSRPLPAEPTRL